MTKDEKLSRIKKNSDFLDKTYKIMLYSDVILCKETSIPVNWDSLDFLTHIFHNRAKYIRARESDNINQEAIITIEYNNSLIFVKVSCFERIQDFYPGIELDLILFLQDYFIMIINALTEMESLEDSEKSIGTLPILYTKETELIQRDAIAEFGIEVQIAKLKEELLELLLIVQRGTVGILKNSISPENNHNIIDEIADAMVVLNQLRFIFDESDINDRIKYKLERLKNRINASRHIRNS